MNQIDLKNRTAIITGGARGIGLEIVKRMRLSGARVMVLDNNTDSLSAARSKLNDDGIFWDQIDVTDFAAVQSVMAEAKSKFGRIDILVNSAGVTGGKNPVRDYPLETWQRILRINLDGTFHTCKAVIPFMEEQGYGRIVNISSEEGRDGIPNNAAYSASKAGVISLTRTIGKELATSGVVVNALAPAVIETEFIDKLDPAVLSQMLARIPMGRMGRPEEVASMVTWMCSEECSFTTGTVFDLSGGQLAW